MEQLRVVVCAVLMLLLAASGVASKEIVQISFLHRHGARQPPERVNGQMSWENAQLTPAGALMAHNMGLFFRARYDGFIPRNYSLQVIESRSTQVARTIQSGYGLLRALFGESNVFNIPFLEHAPLQVDYAMAFNENFPSHDLMEAVFSAWPHNSTLAEAVLTPAEIQQMARAMGGEWCAADPLFCALVAEDVAQCDRSNGVLAPELSALWDKLQTLQMMLNKFALGYKPDSGMAPAGSLAWPILNEWMARATAALSSGGGDGGFARVLHMSAHDNQVLALLNALGVCNQSTFDTEFWVPKFFDTVIAETYADGTVSFFKAKPLEDAASGFPIEIVALSVLCVDSGGRTYSSTACPVADAWRFINTTQPRASPPQCFVPASALVEFNCSAEDVVPPPNSPCARYRAGCLATACRLLPNSDPAAVLDIGGGYVCSSFVSPPNFAEKLPIYLSGFAAALIVGLFVGTGISELLRRTGGAQRFHESALLPNEEQ